MAPVFLPIETSLNLNVLIFGLTLVQLICGLLGGLIHQCITPVSWQYNSGCTESGKLALRFVQLEKVRQISVAQACVKMYITLLSPSNNCDYGLEEAEVLFVLLFVDRVLL